MAALLPGIVMSLKSAFTGAVLAVLSPPDTHHFSRAATPACTPIKAIEQGLPPMERPPSYMLVPPADPDICIATLLDALERRRTALAERGANAGWTEELSSFLEGNSDGLEESTKKILNNFLKKNGLELLKLDERCMESMKQMLLEMSQPFEPESSPEGFLRLHKAAPAVTPT